MLVMVLDVETWIPPSPLVTSLPPASLSWDLGSFHVRRLVGQSKEALLPVVPGGLLVHIAECRLARSVGWCVVLLGLVFLNLKFECCGLAL